MTKVFDYTFKASCCAEASDELDKIKKALYDGFKAGVTTLKVDITVSLGEEYERTLY